MDVTEKILVKKDVLDKIQTKLKGLRVKTQDIDARSEISEMLELIEREMEVKDVISVEDMIKDKMNETKYSNPELNFSLYMLHRKLVDGKIDEEEALKAYEIYIRL